MHSARIQRPRPAVQWLVWCLLLALAVGGWQSVAVSMLGTSHHHRDHSVLHTPAAAMAGWQDFRRAGHLHQSAPAEHVAQQRHHHDADDSSVVALDTAADATAQGDFPPAGVDGSVLMFALGSCTPRAASRTERWPSVNRTALPHPHLQRLERPPQA